MAKISYTETMPAQRLTSQQYLEQLRQQRQQRATGKVTASSPTPVPGQQATTAGQSATMAEPRETSPGVPPSQTQPASEHPYLETLDLTRPQPEETVVEWQAPNRPFKKRTKQFYTTVTLIVFLVSLILFFIGQFLPVAVVLAVAFFYYVLSSVPPELSTYKITSYGIRIDDQLFYWDEMGRFWFKSKYNQEILHIEVARFPFRLSILLGEIDPKAMKEFLSKLLTEQEPEPTPFDRLGQWLDKHIQIDKA